MPNKTKKKASITNAHIHTFTGDHIPPFLAKTFVPWPFHFLFPLHLLVKICRWWYGGPNTWKYKGGFKRLNRYWESL